MVVTVVTDVAFVVIVNGVSVVVVSIAFKGGSTSPTVIDEEIVAEVVNLRCLRVVVTLRAVGILFFL